MDRALAEAVKRAYAVFAAPPPADLSVCTVCCMRPEDEQRILATPQRELTLEHFRDWYFAAFYEDPVAMKWLMPRILDLLARRENPDPLGLPLRRLRGSDYLDGWSAEESAAVERCILLLMRRALRATAAAQDDPVQGWMEWFDAAAEANIPLGPLIEDAMRAPVPLLARELTDLRWEEQMESRLDPWLPGLSEARQAEVSGFLFSPKLLDILSAGLAAETDPDWLWEIERTIETLQRWHADPPG